MTTEFPDRLSVNPRSPHYDATLLERSIGIRLSGVEEPSSPSSRTEIASTEVRVLPPLRASA
jgi:hypothetical protein